MSHEFDAYHVWLGIAPEEQPPNHYRLLGIRLFEDKPDVIENAADQRMLLLKTFQTGRHGRLSQKLLNEIAAAKVCLLNPERKAAYDAQLRESLQRRSTAAEDSDQRFSQTMASLVADAQAAAPGRVAGGIAPNGRSLGKNRTLITVGAVGVVAVVLLAIIGVMLRHGLAPSGDPTSAVSRDNAAAMAIEANEIADAGEKKPLPVNSTGVPGKPPALAAAQPMQPSVQTPAEPSATDASSTPTPAEAMPAPKPEVAAPAIPAAAGQLAPPTAGETAIAVQREPSNKEMLTAQPPAKSTAETPPKPQPPSMASETPSRVDGERTPPPKPTGTFGAGLSNRETPPAKLPPKNIPDTISTEIRLPRKGSPYKLTGRVNITKDGALLIERGATVMASPGSAIIAAGTLGSYGDGDEFVRFRPEVPAMGWDKIDLEKGVDHTLQGFDVRGANRGLYTGEYVKATITGCIFAQNKVGAETKRTDVREACIRLTNCLIADNLTDGITFYLNRVALDRCTVSGNGGVGVNLSYYGHVTASNCTISGNAIGIQTHLYDTTVDVTSSNIMSNRLAIEVKTAQDLQCKGNYWGVTNQQQIALMIIDGLERPGKGIVVFTDFARKSIADAGCSLKIPKEGNAPRRRR